MINNDYDDDFDNDDSLSCARGIINALVISAGWIVVLIIFVVST